MKSRTWMVFLGAIALVTAAAFAGMTLTMRCKSCGFSSPVSSGGGIMFERLGGYCAKCKKFVELRWGRDKQCPASSGEVWDSATGKTIRLYKCPECSQPFMPLQLELFELKFCPKCGKPTLERDKWGATTYYD